MKMSLIHEHCENKTKIPQEFVGKYSNTVIFLMLQVNALSNFLLRKFLFTDFSVHCSQFLPYLRCLL